MRHPFIVAYKGCTCCGRVVPDVRSDQLGQCDVCKTTRQLVPKPLGWDSPAPKVRKSAMGAWTTAWLQTFLSRSTEQLCPHERRALMRVV